VSRKKTGRFIFALNASFAWAVERTSKEALLRTKALKVTLNRYYIPSKKEQYLEKILTENLLFEI
jgi:hypothetical protein